MSAIVIDTNVLLVADGQATQMIPQCRLACLTRLERVQSGEQVVLDHSWLILGEYGNKLNLSGQPTPGRAFLKWLHQRKSMPQHVCYVTITATNNEKTVFNEFPTDSQLLKEFDPADRKFVAVANALSEKPPILQSADSKWLGWESRLANHGIRLEVLCRDELEAIRIRKQPEAMGGEFVKFPTTPHLLWLGSVTARQDKVMARTEAEEFLRGPVTIEEKVDGANLGISFDDMGNLVVQNRGSLLEPVVKGQFAPLWNWLSEREYRLFDVLGDRLIIFGEWCYARHSIRYTLLPDFFLAFDIYDRHEQRFMNIARRDEIVSELEFTAVPKFETGIFRLNEITRFLGESSLYNGPMEGVYLRCESASWLIQRAKVVRAEFVQQIGEHWSKQPLVPNKLKSTERHR